MPAAPDGSVWSAMSYTPPRGQCNFKAGLVAFTCPCLRFMLHPVKAATSFECDGCSHHASYHTMDNPREDEVLKRWAEQERLLEAAPAPTPTSTDSARNKRRRITNGSGERNETTATESSGLRRTRVLDLTD